MVCVVQRGQRGQRGQSRAVAGRINSPRITDVPSATAQMSQPDWELWQQPLRSPLPTQGRLRGDWLLEGSYSATRISAYRMGASQPLDYARSWGRRAVKCQRRDDIFPFQRFVTKVGLVFFSDPFQPFQLLRSLPLGRDNVGARTTILRGLASFTSLINRPFFCKINNKKTPTYLPLHRRRLITRSILLFSFFTRST